MEYPHISTNRFTLLSNLNEIQQDERDHASKRVLPQTTPSSTKATSRLCLGSKIPTIVNGRISYSNSKKPLQKPSNSLRIPNHRSTKPIHKVKIIWNSHLKVSATKLNQYLNSKFEICSLIKPGACANQLVSSQENELKCLGKNDVIVINGGASDIDKPSCKENEILALMIYFIQKYDNTNIIIVNIHQRYNLTNAAKTNFCTQAYNSKLKKILKTSKHVSLVEMRHFTKHGFHTNNSGKEWFVKLAATQIEMLIKSTNKSELAIPLNWKEETTTLNIPSDNRYENDMLSIKLDPVEALIPSNQTQNNPKQHNR